MGWHFYTPAVTPSIGTALPSNPVDGQEFTLVDSLSAPTYAWRLRYIAAKSSNKWQFVGGSPLEAEVATGETTTEASYSALSTAGPSVAVPVAGDYFVEHGFTSYSTAKPNWMSYDIGGTGAVDADAVEGGLDSVADAAGSFARRKKKSGLTAVTLTAKYKASSGNTVGFKNRWISIIPIAIGG